MAADGSIEVTVEVETPPPAQPPAVSAPDIELPTEFRNVVLTTILAILIFYTLYFARAVFVPVLLAMLIRLFLQLPMNFLTRHRVPRLVAVFIVMVGLFGGIGCSARRWAGRPRTGSPRRRRPSPRCKTGSRSSSARWRACKASRTISRASWWRRRPREGR